MTTSDIISVIGLIVALALGIAGFFVVSKRVRKQRFKQEIKHGTGYQAGRDVNIHD
jgi:hypothetical protein